MSVRGASRSAMGSARVLSRCGPAAADEKGAPLVASKRDASPRSHQLRRAARRGAGGGARATLYLLDEANDELVSRIVQGREVQSIRLKVGQGIAGHVAKTGKSLH